MTTATYEPDPNWDENPKETPEQMQAWIRDFSKAWNQTVEPITAEQIEKDAHEERVTRATRLASQSAGQLIPSAENHRQINNILTEMGY